MNGIDRAAAITVAALLTLATASAQTLRLASLAQGETRRTAPLAQDQARVTFEQASHVLKALPSNLPVAFRGRSLDQIARLWPQWVEEHDRQVRARLERGDDDSLVNFWSSDYGVHVALETIVRQRTLAPGRVRRVAIVGPGLDFTNKTDGYDYYPQQTIQPFALIDALRRLELAAADLQVTTFDINARVNDHLKNAASRARSRSGHIVTLPLDGQEAWTDALLAYWRQWGNAIGDEVTTVPPPASAGTVTTRAVRIRSDVVSAIVPRDFNVVVDRLHSEERERFDLIVATNVLLYYDVFEQALAAANVAAMLKPGGLFVTNTAILSTPPLRPSASYLRVAHTVDRYDEMFWYQRE